MGDTRWRVIVGTAALGSLLACNQVEPVPDDGSDALPEDVVEAFRASCATVAGCHVSGGQPPLLDDPSVSSLIEQGQVTPGSLEGSRIAVKILELPGIVGGVMPPPGEPAEQEDLNLIIQWIEELEVGGTGGDTGATGDATATGEADDGPPPPPGPDDCLLGTEPSTPPSFSELWPMLEVSCASVGCHGGMQGPVMTDEATAYANLLDGANPGGMAFVTPESPDDSYLWHKLAGTHLSVMGGAGGRMPTGPALCNGGLVGVYAWILGGAQP